MQNLTNALGSLWQNSFCRYALILGCVGFVPFYFLSLAMATIR